MWSTAFFVVMAATVGADEGSPHQSSPPAQTAGPVSDWVAGLQLAAYRGAGHEAGVPGSGVQPAGWSPVPQGPSHYDDQSLMAGPWRPPVPRHPGPLVKPQHLHVPLGTDQDYFPAWYFQTDGLWLRRSVAGDVRIAEQIFTSTRSRLDLSQVDFHHEPGARVSLARGIFDGMAYLEGTYYGMHHWGLFRELRARPDFTIANVATSFLLDPLTSPFGDGVTDALFVDYAVDLHSGDLNLRMFLTPEASIVLGVGHVNLHETYQIDQVGRGTVFRGAPNQQVVPQRGVQRIVTKNSMTGPHVGGSYGIVPLPYLEMGLVGKIGVYFTDASAKIDQMLDRAPDQPLSVRTHENSTRGTPIAEMAFSTTYHLHRNIVLRGGYHLLYLRGVALAHEQIAPSIYGTSSVARMNATDHGVFHGPFGGIEIRWGEL